jgi:hypothetical protein
VDDRRRYRAADLATAGFEFVTEAIFSSGFEQARPERIVDPEAGVDDGFGDGLDLRINGSKCHVFPLRLFVFFVSPW